MSLSVQQLELIVNELNQILPSARVQECFVAGGDVLNILLYKEKVVYNLLVSLYSNAFRLHLSYRKFRPLVPQPNFGLYLKKHLTGMFFTKCEVLNNDRIVRLGFEKNDANNFLIAHLFPKGRNIFFVDDKEQVLYSYDTKKHPLYAYQYILPRKDDDLTSDYKKNDITNSDYTLFNYEVDDYYVYRYSNNNSKKKIEKFYSFLNKEKKAIKKQIAKLGTQLERTNDYLDLQQKGELLKASFYKIKKGDKSFQTVNYYSDELEHVVIDINPLLTPQQNIDKYFKKAKKLKSSVEHIESQIFDKNKKLITIIDMINDVQPVSTEGQLKEVLSKYNTNPLVKYALLRWGRQIADKKQKKPSKLKKTSFRHFLSWNDTPIYVGRNSQENMRLTFSFAKGNHVWLHARDYHGSHVVIRKPKNVEVDQKTLYEAAQLALFYSKGKNSNGGEVLWTYKKHVHKSKRGQQGSVFVSKFKVLNVDIDKDKIRQLKETSTIS